MKLRMKGVIPQEILYDLINRGYYLSDNMEHAYSPIGTYGDKLYFITIGNYQMEISSRRVYVSHYNGYHYMPITKDDWNDGAKEFSDKLLNIKKLMDKI